MNTIVIDHDFQWELSDLEKYGPLALPKDEWEKLIYIPPFDPERDLHFSFRDKPVLCLEVGVYNPELEIIPAIRR